jgi:hypothetical protein
MRGVALLAIGVLGVTSCAHASSPQTYDGKWWVSASKDQRIGFLSGYADCAIFDVGKPGLRHFSSINAEPILSKYYSDHIEEQTTEVEPMLWKLWVGSKPIEHPPKGETYKSKHGFFDGEYWKQATPSHRLGFIQGYLYCQKRNSKPEGSFTNTPDWYVTQISKWYGLKSPDSDEIDESKADKKIADVLLILKDKGKSSVPSK